MTSVGTPSAATASTVVRTSRVRVPFARAISAARATVGPSIVGSLYGRPISTMSTPPSTMAAIASRAPATDGNPAGR